MNSYIFALVRRHTNNFAQENLFDCPMLSIEIVLEFFYYFISRMVKKTFKNNK